MLDPYNSFCIDPKLIVPAVKFYVFLDKDLINLLDLVTGDICVSTSFLNTRFR